jgi:serine/threonine protein kinase
MLAPDTVLQNRYLIVRLIAQGGMGAVYQAIDQRLGNTVALKETFFSDEHLRKAFEREARMLAGLRHSALPKVSDHFAEDNGQFLVMEFITGNDLADLLSERNEPFPLDEVLAWTDKLLDALEYLHSQSQPVIHRDIKPHNLKLTKRGEIILLDFGLAKGASTQVVDMTAAKSVFGYTPQYAPLEQIQGDGTDERSDLYSLAATMYHLMTGSTPSDALSRVSSVINGRPDPLRPASEINPNIPVAVAQVFMQAMALNREQRYADAAQMRAALRDAGRSIDSRGNDAPTVVNNTKDLKNRPTIPNPSAVHTVPDRFPDTKAQQQQNGKPWLWVAFGGAGILVVGLIAVVALVMFLKMNNQTGNVEPSKPAPVKKETDPAVPPPTVIGPYKPPSNTSFDTAQRVEERIVRGESLNRSDLTGLSTSELKRLRNTVYARHGRTFKTPELQQYFDSRSWYRPRNDYSEADLTQSDQSNVKLIQQAENE